MTEAAAEAATHHSVASASRDVAPVSRDDADDDAQVKTTTTHSSQSGVSSWSRDGVTRWLADNQLLSLQNWYNNRLLLLLHVLLLLLLLLLYLFRPLFAW